MVKNTRRRESRQLGDLLGELDHRFAQVQVEVCITFAAWACTAAVTAGIVVADHRGEHATEEVEVAVVLDVEDVAAFATIDRDRDRRRAGW